MIQVTAQQRANAIEARDVMWPSVPPENVTQGLRHWQKDFTSGVTPNCGSLACFGGWWEVWTKKEVKWSCKKDFGVQAFTFSSIEIGLFEVRGGSPITDKRFKGTDHELVTHRLNWLINNSEVV